MEMFLESIKSLIEERIEEEAKRKTFLGEKIDVNASVTNDSKIYVPNLIHRFKRFNDLPIGALYFDVFSDRIDLVDCSRKLTLEPRINAVRVCRKKVDGYFDPNNLLVYTNFSNTVFPITIEEFDSIVDGLDFSPHIHPKNINIVKFLDMYNHTFLIKEYNIEGCIIE